MNRTQYLVPVAILIAGLLIAVALYMVRISDNPLRSTSGDVSSIRPVSVDDHLLGNPEAKVKLVVYSDIDCGYCKQYDEALKQVMSDHASAGDIAWVYRHFPVIEAHPNAATHAEAAECVASLGGTTAFWSFIDALHAEAPGDAEFDPAGYPSIVESLGLSGDAFSSCMASDTMQAGVGEDYDNAISIGATGAPYTVVLIDGAESIPISGAIPYSALKEVVDMALQKAQ